MSAPKLEDSYEYFVAKKMADAIYEESMSKTKEEVIELIIDVFYEEERRRFE